MTFCLQPETDAEAKGAGKDGERSEVDADGIDRRGDGRDDEGGLDELYRENLNRRRQAGRPADLPFQKVRDEDGEPQQDREDEKPLDHAERRDTRRPEGDCKRVQKLRGRFHEVENVERREAPRHDANYDRPHGIADEPTGNADHDPRGQQAGGEFQQPLRHVERSSQHHDAP
jgi:hypothetical protein